MASCDARFGPQVDTTCRSFDFTLYFEDLILSMIPSAILLAVAIISLDFGLFDPIMDIA